MGPLPFCRCPKGSRLYQKFRVLEYGIAPDPLPNDVQQIGQRVTELQRSVRAMDQRLHDVARSVQLLVDGLPRPE